MKAARYYGPLDVRIEEVPEPGPPGPGEVVIHVEMAALCGTDVSQYITPTMIPLTRPHPVSGRMAPLTLGHEMVGTIVAVGEGVSNVAVGERVVPGAGQSCGSCEPCRVGRSNICPHSTLYGIHADGGLAEYVRVPAGMCMPVPHGCRLEAAVLAQPLAVALHALDRADLKGGEVVALFGVGGMGSLMVAVWKCTWPGLMNVEPEPRTVVAIDIDAQRLARAAALGVSRCLNASLNDPVEALRRLTDGRGVDVAIEATGNPGSIATALAAIRPGGRVVQVGLPTGLVPLPVGEMVRAEKELIPTNGQICECDLPYALEMLTSTNLADLVSTQIIDLADLVDNGLRAQAERRTSARILVRIPCEPVSARR